MLIDPIVSVKNLTELTHSNININETNKSTVQYNVLGNPIIKGATDIKRRDVCNYCFKHDYNYVIVNPDICKLYSGLTEIELLIIILTVHNNVQQRNVLRET